MDFLYKFLTFFTFIFGTIGNFICFIIYSRKIFAKISITFYFKAISINNCIILLQMLRYFIQSSFNYDLELVSDFSCKLFGYMVYSTIPISTWIMVYVVFDRFVSICFFTKFKFLQKLKFKCLILSAIYFASFCIYIPVGIYYKILSNYRDMNQTIATFTCNFYKNGEFISIIDFIFSTILPSSLMVVFTSLSINVIYNSRKRFAKHVIGANRLRKDTYFALTSIFLNFVFLCTGLPTTLYGLFSLDTNHYFESLIYINCAISVFIHTLSNRIFYREFLSLLHFKLQHFRDVKLNLNLRKTKSSDENSQRFEVVN